MTTLAENFPGFSNSFMGSEELERVVESLWQRGYDVKRDGYGWTIREPMGAGFVTLKSDADLIEFAAAGGRRRRVVTVQPVVQPAVAHRASVLPRQSVQSSREPEARIAVSQQGVRQSSPVWFAWAGWVRLAAAQFCSMGTRPTVWQGSVRHVLAGGLVFLILLVGWLMSGNGSIQEVVPEESDVTRQLTADTTGQPAKDEKVDKLAIRNPATAVRTNSQHVPGSMRESEPMVVLQDVAEDVNQSHDLSVFAHECARRLKERFSTNDLSLLVNVQGRHAEKCYLIDGVEHCPYVMHGQATLSFVDEATSPPLIYACDIDLKKAALGNLRRVEANPDIVRFLVGEPRGGA